tara:strand:+ start:1485 stop:1949 length:465 start_codon:yes stop_codon:yes gene_type:complete
MKNKKKMFWIALAVILTAGVYYFYSRRNSDGKLISTDDSSSGASKLYQYSWIGCNSCPSENVTNQMLEQNKSGFAGINIDSGFTASGKVAIGDKVQIINNVGSDVEGTYNVIGIGSGCSKSGSYADLIVIDLSWNCSSNPMPSSSNGGVLRFMK